MIAILPPPGRIATGRLQVCKGIGGIANVLIGGRNRQPGQTLDGGGIADERVVLAQIGKPRAAP